MERIFEIIIEYINRYKHLLEIIERKDFFIAFIVLIICALPVSFFRQDKEHRKIISFAILIPYLYLLFAFTVFRRTELTNPIYVLLPFETYIKAFKTGEVIFIVECILNIILFLPIGICLAKIEVPFKYALLCGIVISYAIEICQLITNRGWFELFDDPIHNILGCIIGYIWIARKRIRK